VDKGGIKTKSAHKIRNKNVINKTHCNGRTNQRPVKLWGSNIVHDKLWD